MNDTLQVILGGAIVLPLVYLGLRLFVKYADWHERTFYRAGKHGGAVTLPEVVRDKDKPLGSKDNPLRVKKVTRWL